MSSFKLTNTTYGKEKVRLLRVVRNGNWHEVAEYTISVLLDGKIEASYSKADNSVVVATDSMKNTVNVFAKKSAHVLIPELFALQLAQHFITEYDHIKKASIAIISHRWSRLPISSQPHPHAFLRDGNDTLKIEAVLIQDESNLITAKLNSGFNDLLVLKSTGSSFENFIRDKWTTLEEVSDRILSTSIDCDYEIEIEFPKEGFTESLLDKIGIDFKEVNKSIRDITLETFANDESASVQATLFKMCEIILGRLKVVKEISYSLPNKHYVPINLDWHDKIQNTSVKDAEVYLPLESPAGLIKATVSR